MKNLYFVQSVWTHLCDCQTCVVILTFFFSVVLLVFWLLLVTGTPCPLVTSYILSCLVYYFSCLIASWLFFPSPSPGCLCVPACSLATFVCVFLFFCVPHCLSICMALEAEVCASCMSVLWWCMDSQKL